ncbi:hypothetical protein AKJ44_01510 [candidate division MSBL1 archaeon SCGC-AAA261F17]|uniref:Uncharacterized protein n=2 Tax=candidate division MSBL1 TaxID=215777 RepID=A0A133V6H9_9EURY|nr:hypothetical protein AKJ44_01510 [candidate division MSBL1 archaeon SCGC-AAA261F17]KXB03944.1 hypothetical protein AKJ47_01405 [candidate division MSBL1 archaeon SCGC-AAA261G05]
MDSPEKLPFVGEIEHLDAFGEYSPRTEEYTIEDVVLGKVPKEETLITWLLKNQNQFTSGLRNE